MMQRHPRYDFTTGQLPVTTTPQMASGQNDRRDTLAITNLGPATVYLGGYAGVTATSGYALLPGASLDLHTNAEVWVVAAATGTTVTTLEVSER